jgi:hypothetical protein
MEHLPFNNSLFIDSGAHGLYNEHVLRKGHKHGYGWFETNGFKHYMDKFAEFIKKNESTIKNYANVDVIFNPELTWKSQEYLEKEHGLHPIPVIHFGTPRKWLEKYLDKGYDYIALGGLGQEAQQSHYVAWADNMFEIICNNKDKLPVCKVHGFAMTSWYLMTRYPWWSVDSTTWLSLAMYGQLIVPPRVKGKWRYDKQFNIVRASETSSKVKKQVRGHLMKYVEDYVHEKGFSIGKNIEIAGKKLILEPGVANDTHTRSTLNALYFVDLSTEYLPKWPWPFINQKKLL